MIALASPSPHSHNTPPIIMLFISSHECRPSNSAIHHHISPPSLIHKSFPNHMFRLLLLPPIPDPPHHDPFSYRILSPPPRAKKSIGQVSWKSLLDLHHIEQPHLSESRWQLMPIGRHADAIVQRVLRRLSPFVFSSSLFLSWTAFPFVPIHMLPSSLTTNLLLDFLV